jgi:ATP-dependent Clp protease adaptor protein ClpS
MERAEQNPKTGQQTRHCPMYKVLIHNDDVTTYPFVLDILTAIFKLGMVHAREVALKAHCTGIALVDILPYEQAEFRIEHAHSLARMEKYPLKLTFEPK